MADPPRQPIIPTEPAWVRLCRWLWGQRKFVWGVLIVGIIIGVSVNYLTSSTSIFTGTPLGTPPLGTILLWTRGHLLLAGFVGVGLLGLTGGLWLINRLHPAPASQQTSPPPQAVLLTGEGRRRLLARLRSLYQDYLKQSLSMPRMELGLERTFEATAHPALSVSYRPTGVREAIAPSTPILDVYQEAGDGLLILGKPGAGKSTLLSDLALALTERAERHATQLPPVLVSLTSWAEKRLPLEQWLAEEIHTKYQIRRPLTVGWLLADQVLPLLDGLDEMPEEARSACIEAINTYRQEHPLPIVVSSRSAAYLAQERKLHLQSAIEVQPLTPHQVDGYLKGEGEPLAAVRRALQRDAVLRDLVTTPLMLTVVMRTYGGKTDKDLPGLGTAKEQQCQVFEHYVTRVLEPTAKPTRKWRYTPDSTQKWLTWLAQQLQKRSLTEFYLENLQASWVPIKQARILSLWLVGLVAGLLFGLLFGLTFGLTFGLGTGLEVGLPFGLLIGFFFGPGLEGIASMIAYLSAELSAELSAKPLGKLVSNLFGGLDGWPRAKSREIVISDVLGWSWRRFWSGLIIGLIFTLLTSLLNGMISKVLSGQLFSTVGGALLLALFIGFFFGLANTSLNEEKRTKPNQGIHNSGLNAIRVGLPVGVVTTALSSPLSVTPPGGLLGWLVYGLIGVMLFGLVGGLFAGGRTYLAHYTLRYLLWQSGVLPWHAIRFLNEATERALIQLTVGGGGYSFFHPLLQEYFASIGTGTPANT